jgi:hypothetical protein
MARLCSWERGGTLAGREVRSGQGSALVTPCRRHTTTGMLVRGNGVPVESGVGHDRDPTRQPSTRTRGKRAVRVSHTDRSVRAAIRSVLLIGRRVD